MDSTGRGTVTNSAKLFFEFNRQSWSDKRSMPSVGMLVEFRAEGKTITSVRPSRYQEFKEGDFITENDFWRTENDEALEDLQSSMRCKKVLPYKLIHSNLMSDESVHL